MDGRESREFRCCIARRCRSLATALAIFLSSLSSGQAGVSVCDQPTDDSYVSFGVDRHDESGIGANNSVDLRSTRLDLLVVASDSWRFGLGHRYDKFDFDPLQLQTNGHLHTVYFPVHRQGGSDRNSFRLSVAPALTASSNVFDEPGEYRSDALHLFAALIWSRDLSDRTSLRFGFCGDNRFGEYEAYPSASISWQPHADWTIELGFPTNQLTYQATPIISSSLRVAPDGNEWYVKDKSLTNDSQFVYEAILAEWVVNWQVSEQFTIAASIGRQFDIEYDVTLLDGSELQLSGDSTTRIGAALTWRF